MSKTYNILSVVFIMGAFASGSYAAPSIRMLGTGGVSASGNTNVLLPKATGSVDSSNSSISRTNIPGGRGSSIRAIGTTSVKPVSISKSPSAAVLSQTSDDSLNRSNVSRLSVGKYLHNSGVNSGLIKPVQSVGTGTVSDLIAKITELETKISQKQNVMEYGDGLVVEGDTLKLSSDITDDITNLIARVDAMQEQLKNKADSTVVYTKNEIEQVLEDREAEEQRTIFDANTKTNEAVSLVYADDWDKEVLTSKDND